MRLSREQITLLNLVSVSSVMHRFVNENWRGDALSRWFVVEVSTNVTIQTY